jgi:hypothetical protein
MLHKYVFKLHRKGKLFYSYHAVNLTALFINYFNNGENSVEKQDNRIKILSANDVSQGLDLG